MLYNAWGGAGLRPPLSAMRHRRYKERNFRHDSGSSAVSTSLECDLQTPAKTLCSLHKPWSRPRNLLPEAEGLRTAPAISGESPHENNERQLFRAELFFKHPAIRDPWASSAQRLLRPC